MSNPYRTGSVVYEDDYYGRKELIEELLDDRRQCIYLIGNRHMGKTSTLHYLLRRTKCIPVYFSLDGTDGNPAEILKNITLNIRITENKILLSELDFSSIVSIYSLFEKLAQLASAHKTKVLLLIDEAEELLSMKTSDLKMFCQKICLPNLRVILTASKGLSALYDRCRSWKTTHFLDNFEVHYLPLFKVAETRQLILQEKRIDKSEETLPTISADPLLIDQIIDLTGGHPYLVQHLCYKLYQRADDSLKSIEDRHKSLDDGLSAFFQSDFDVLSPIEQEILIALSRTVSLSHEDLFGVIQSRLDLSEPIFQIHLRGLEQLGYIISRDDQFSISNHFLRTWLLGGKIDRGHRVLSNESSQTSIKKMTDNNESEVFKPTIGIITALGIEYIAVMTLIESGKDKIIDGIGKCYIGKFSATDNDNQSIVLAQAGKGNNFSALCAEKLFHKYPSIKTCVMVGIAGGVPAPDDIERHVRLGDIVVSGEKGIVQYDFIKKTSKKDENRFPPRAPKASFLKTAETLKREEAISRFPWLKYINDAIQCLGENWKYPVGSSEQFQNKKGEITEQPSDSTRHNNEPRIFIGTIASGNTLLKDYRIRERLRRDLSALAVEMEVSGVADASWMNEIGYFSVRGICDYCDKTKNDVWQKYASVVAAAYTKALILCLVD